MNFCPGSVVLIAQADIDGQVAGDAPVVLDVGGVGIAAHSPFLTGALACSGGNQAQPEVGGIRQGLIVGEVQMSQHSVVSGVRRVFTHPPVLEAEVNDVTAAGPDHAF